MQDTEIQDLINNFLTKIYSKGLCKEAEDSKYKNLVSKVNEISVISLCMCATQIVTISKGEDGTPEYRQVSFAAHTDEPYSTLYLRSIECSYEEALDLINQASKRFESGSNAMQHKAVSYAGVIID
ncbi:MAG: hypothetical protein WC180_03070 [Candidatus Paceibacterota bacterium]